MSLELRAGVVADQGAGEPLTAATPRRKNGMARKNGSRLVWLLLWIGVLALAVAASLALGSKPLPLDLVWRALTAYDGSNDAAIVLELRVPRTISGLLVGAALGLAGALIQALTRNPLADPGILGVNAGASFAVTIGVALFGGLTIYGMLWWAFAGAIAATVTVYAIGSLGRGGGTPIRLTLAGVAFGAVLGGVASGITLLRPDVFDAMRHWGAGSLSGQTVGVVGAVAPFILVGVVIGVACTRPLNAIALGDDLARAVGARIVPTRIAVVIAVTLLCGAATAAVGPVGFVGLMVPHIARWFVGPDQRWIVPFTLVGAPVLLLVSDVVGRLVLRPGELQVGIVTAFIGAPVLIWLVRRSKASGL